MEIKEQLKAALAEHPNISKLINDRDIEKWNKKLLGYNNYITDYLEKENYNILTSLMIWNYNRQDAINLLAFLEDSLNVFPELIASNEFKRNIKSLNEFGFFSFLSELSLAKQFKANSFKVTFNKKYNKLLSSGIKEKDVDLQVTDGDGNVTYIEVYSPYKKSQHYGFIDPESIKGKFDHDLIDKQRDKFHGLIMGQLKGEIIMAVNIAYHDDYNITRVLPGNDNSKHIQRIRIDNVNRIILFNHDIAREGVLAP
jgi:hypothetical protein